MPGIQSWKRSRQSSMAADEPSIRSGGSVRGWRREAKRLQSLQRSRKIAPARVGPRRGNGETGRISKMIKGTLYRRLERLEARVLPAREPDRHRIVFISAEDGKAVSSFLMG